MLSNSLQSPFQESNLQTSLKQKRLTLSHNAKTHCHNTKIDPHKAIDVLRYRYMQPMYYTICMTEVVTIRVDKTLKKKIKKYKIPVSKITREALEEEIKKHEKQQLTNAINEMKTLLSKIPDEEIIKTIRESRDQRWPT
jgi:post-segregation antitoxin (ccd killing protein)